MPERILVVDDDQDSLQLISMMLQRSGYDVSTATAGNPGLQKAIEELPDLILLDVMMPDMDGFEVCRRLRGEPSTADTPIIMFTAKTLVEDKIDGFEAGANDYLTKPTHAAELVARVKRALNTAPRASEPTVTYAPGKRGQSFGFVGVKGGTGTTSLAVSVGALLAQSQSVILADIRPGQGTLGVALGVADNSGVSRVLSLPASGITPEAVTPLLINHSSNMRLLLSSLNPQEVTLNYTPESVLALKNVMVDEAYYSLFDLGAGLERITVPLMRELDRTVVITEPNMVSITAASSVLHELETRINRDKIRLVMSNRAQSSKQVSWQEVEKVLGYEVAAIISAAPQVAFEAAELGMAITQFQPDSIIAGQISKFVEEMIKQTSTTS